MGNIMAQATEKLQAELSGIKQPYIEKPVVDYLCGYLDGALATQIVIEHKSLKKCMDYIQSEARKRLNGNNGALPDQDVYSMAIAYYMRDDAEEERKKAEEAEKRREESKARQQKAEADREAAAAKIAEKKATKDSQLSLFELMGGSANA